MQTLIEFNAEPAHVSALETQLAGKREPLTIIKDPEQEQLYYLWLTANNSARHFPRIQALLEYYRCRIVTFPVTCVNCGTPASAEGFTDEITGEYICDRCNGAAENIAAKEALLKQAPEEPVSLFKGSSLHLLRQVFGDREVRLAGDD